MAVEIKRVSYTFNSALEDLGVPAYFLDCLISQDGETLVDRHESYKSREEFMEAIQELIPVIEEVNDSQD
jgi:hypothetical protein